MAERGIPTLGRPLDSIIYVKLDAMAPILAMVAAPHCTGCTGDLHPLRTVIRRAGRVSLDTRRSTPTTACASDDVKTQRFVARTPVHGVSPYFLRILEFAMHRFNAPHRARMHEDVERRQLGDKRGETTTLKPARCRRCRGADAERAERAHPRLTCELQESDDGVCRGYQGIGGLGAHLACFLR